jgi:hypothetical protein
VALDLLPLSFVGASDVTPGRRFLLGGTVVTAAAEQQRESVALLSGQWRRAVDNLADALLSGAESGLPAGVLCDGAFLFEGGDVLCAGHVRACLPWVASPGATVRDAVRLTRCLLTA